MWIQPKVCFIPKFLTKKKGQECHYTDKPLKHIITEIIYYRSLHFYHKREGTRFVITQNKINLKTDLVTIIAELLIV